ncbi:Gfo/Idh/MocA family protein [Sanguibacter gelidistatuariae]|uniref:Gfo/Idh/MocA family protein n=1 Tax=Sanguibacter gelidistatuariae TaxID=1814289 RepID=UPI00158804D7|nr:Gfo/Idh/MocA family oxidoreductase [Sanguibacter gelidistatuariae]
MSKPTAAPLRLGVVGLGGIAQTAHLPLLRRRWDLFDVTAIADLSRQRRDMVGAGLGIPQERRHSDLVSMLDAGPIDGVVLLTGGSHGPETLECVRRGIPVLCEKPLAFTLAEADAIATAEAEQGRPLVLVGYMKEYDDAVVQARSAIPATGIRAVDVEVLHPADGAQLAFANLLPAPSDVDPVTLAALTDRTALVVDAAVGVAAPAMLRTLYTNVLLGSIVHDVSLLRHLLGGIEDIDGARHWPPDVMPGSVEVSGSIAGGARLHIGWHFIPGYPAYRETVTIHHGTGSVQLVFGVPYVLNLPTELTVVSATGTGEERAVSRASTEAFENELVAFHAMVVDGTAPRSGVAHGRADIATAQLMAHALAQSAGVELGGECSP